MKKKLAVLSTTIMLGFGSFVAIPSVKADTFSQLQSQKSNLEGQRSGIQASLSQANSSLSQVQAQLAKLNEQINRVDKAIEQNSAMMASTENKINDTNAEVADLKKQIGVIQDRIAKRNGILKQRAQSFQETGGNLNYLDVLLGASSFSDLIDRVSAITTMVQADQDLIKQHEADKQEVVTKQASVEKRLSDLTSMKADLQAMQAQIVSQKAQNDALKQQLQQKEQAGLAQKADLQKQDSSLATQQAQIEQSLLAQSVPVTSNSSDASGTNTTSRSSSNSGNNSTPVAAGRGGVGTVLSAGYRYIGNSVYVFGGGRTSSDIANGFFDCSGFVHWAFAQAGISVGASTNALTGAGRRVPASQMQPGDLVFFNTYKTDGHVGIYMGGGKFIGSQDSTGVAVANMSSGYWAQHFNGRVVRVF